MDEIEIYELENADREIISMIENHLADGNKVSLVIKKPAIVMPIKINDSDSKFQVHFMSIDNSQFEVPIKYKSLDPRNSR